MIYTAKARQIQAWKWDGDLDIVDELASLLEGDWSIEQDDSLRIKHYTIPMGAYLVQHDKVFVVTHPDAFEKVWRDHDEVLEDLAAHEHEQWSHWTEHMLSVIFPRLFDGSQVDLPSGSVKRWLTRIRMPYSGLSEEEKASNIEWAEKTLQVLRGGS